MCRVRIHHKAKGKKAEDRALARAETFKEWIAGIVDSIIADVVFSKIHSRELWEITPQN